MVLVGLGVDSRAKRMVNFLADTGLDIRLLTFHAFEVDGTLLLARQVETSDPAPSRSTTPTKESNRRILHETAQKEGVEELLEEVVAFIDKHLPAAYRYPGKTAYSYSLQEKTSEGRPSLRSYVTLYVNWKRSGALLLTFPPRVEDVAPEAVRAFLSSVQMASYSSSKSSSISFEVDFTEADWPQIKEHLGFLLSEMFQGWAAKKDAE